jgi:hypothetical protein
MIRDATAGDAEALVRLGEDYVAEAGLTDRLATEFCPQSFLSTCEALARTGIMLVAEHDGVVVGMLGAAFIPILWNYKVLQAQETWFYVRPAKRKGLRKETSEALLKEYEKRASAKGVQFSGIVQELGPRRVAVGRLYEAKGYAPAESVFLKRLAVH